MAGEGEARQHAANAQARAYRRTLRRRCVLSRTGALAACTDFPQCTVAWGITWGTSAL
jgi:hypothetical protein